MRRDYFTLDVQTGSGPPTATVHYTGPAAAFEDRLRERAGTPADPEPDGLDVTYRLLGGTVAEGQPGVFAVTDRVTGEFLLEANVDAGAVEQLVDTARDHREADGQGRYQLVIGIDDGPTWTFEKSAILVYDGDGDVLRGHSLVPNGVEL